MAELLADTHTHRFSHTQNESLFFFVGRSSARLKAILVCLSIQNKYSKTKKEASETYSSRTVHMFLNNYISVSVFR